MTQKVDLANQFIAENVKKVNPIYRHHYHLMAPIGWINDPNGFIYYQGAYHLFYQYYPYESKWGPMHWGHAKSEDLVHWEHLPVALAPDEAYDANGCYSGSAIAHEDKLYLIYTGHVEQDGVRREVQCLAMSEDGNHFEKYRHNPIISEVQLEGLDADIADFRDPKIFEREGQFYCIVASKTSEDLGQILLFKSNDLKNWTFFSTLLTGEAKHGTMWECPDLFHLDGKDVLILSPIAMPTDGFAYENLNSTLAFIGEVDWTKGHFKVENEHEIDGGLDFYAPRTCQGPNGKRIMVAWMQMWQRTLPTDDKGHLWAGAMTLPRELSVDKLRLVQKPVPVKLQPKTQRITVSGDKTVLFKDLMTDSCYLKFELDISKTSQVLIALLKSEKSALKLSFDVDTQILTFDRTDFGLPLVGQEQSPLNRRHIKLSLADSEWLIIEIYKDTSSIEIFLNGGVALTATFYEIEKSQAISICTDGELNGTLTYSDIK